MASVAAGYLPILLFLIIALGLSTAFVVLPMLVARLTGAHKPDPAKLSEYECGFPAFEDARAEFDVRFYLVAILFIVFDLEAAFLFPWAVSLDFTKWTGWTAMIAFLIELALGLSAGFVVLPMLVSRLTGAHKPDPAKLSEYECGFPAFEDARAEFDVRFYLVAILFIVFDLEAAFLFPWAVSLDFTRMTGWVAMMGFLAELGLGLAYAWKKGALEWE